MKHPCWHSIWILAYFLLVITSLGVSNAHADVIIDNGGGGTSSTGTWAVSGATGSYGSVSVWSRDGAKYTWSYTPTVSGNYQVSMWWTAYSSRSTAVPVDIRHSGGTARVTINQQANGGKWNVLGSYSLIGGTTYTVTITSQPGPSSTCADAVQFAYLGGGGNQPPVANNDSAATPPNTPVTIDVIANDTDDVGINAASVAIVNPPTSGTAVPDGSGSVTYTPSGGFTGVDTFQYTVADGQGVASNPAMVAVTVNTVSAEVVIDNGGPGTSFTGVWQISGATGSYGSNSVWSRDGAKYTWSFTPTLSGNYQVSMWWTAYSSRSTAVPVDIKHSGGTARVTINQQLNGGKWNVLGTYSLIGGVTYTVTVTSQPGPSSTCADAVKFSYFGGGGNQPPVANNDSATTRMNTPVTINVIANDTDDVGINAASVTIVNPPASGTAVPDGSGSVTYTPSGGFTGVDTFTYAVADGQGAVSNQATVTVTVNAQNSPPSAVDDSAVTTMNAAVTIHAIVNDTDDVGIDAASVQVVTSPASGTAVPNADGTVTYTPEEAFTGTDTFTYTVADGQGAVSNIATVTVTVNAQNSPPSAADDSAVTEMNTPVTINVISNDTDDVGIDAASVQVVTSPASGTAVSNGNGTVTYTPGTGFIGADAFTYTVADGQGAVSSQATVTVTVNAAPVEVVIDNGGPGTSYTGTWAASGATGSYGTVSVWARDGAKYTWSFTPTLSGNYQVSMWWTAWSSRSTAVPVDIRHSGGTARVTVNQQANGGKWNVLGSWSLIGGVTYTVTVTSQPGPSSTCADAVKFTYVGGVGNLPPIAVIDSISPNLALPGAAVEFTGHGTDSDGGVISAYSWRSNIDGVLSSSASFSTSALSTGQHTIYFKVQDDMGSWSTEASAHIDVTHQALNTEHIYVALMYGAPLRPDYIAMIEGLGGYRDGEVWKYTNLSNGKIFIIHFVKTMEDATLALYTENAHVVLGGHANYGLGGLFNLPGDTGYIIPNVYYIDDVRIWNFSSPWIGVSVHGLISHQSYPNWWPKLQDGTSGIMPYDFNDPSGNPPYNYYHTYQIPGDPTHYKIETVRNGAVDRFPSSGVTPWYSPDGSTPLATNPSHAGYFITNTDTGGDYGYCGAKPCPKPHYGSKTIIFRKDLEIDVSKLKYKRLLLDTCSSSQYFLGTFSKGIVFYTLGSVDGYGGILYLKNYLRGLDDEQNWLNLAKFQVLYDYYDFNKRPTEQ